MILDKLRALPFYPSRHRLQLAAESLNERLHGLDFTMPDRMEKRGRGDGTMYYASPNVMARVVARIREQCRGREILLIYYRPRYTEAIEAGGLFRCEAELHDEVKGYDARIYRGRMPDGGGTFSAAGASKAVTALLLFSDGGGGTMRQRRMPGRRPGRIESDTHHLTTQ